MNIISLLMHFYFFHHNYKFLSFASLGMWPSTGKRQQRAPPTGVQVVNFIHYERIWTYSSLCDKDTTHLIGGRSPASTGMRALSGFCV